MPMSDEKLLGEGSSSGHLQLLDDSSASDECNSPVAEADDGDRVAFTLEEELNSPVITLFTKLNMLYEGVNNYDAYWHLVLVIAIAGCVELSLAVMLIFFGIRKLSARAYTSVIISFLLFCFTKGYFLVFLTKLSMRTTKTEDPEATIYNAVNLRTAGRELYLPDKRSCCKCISYKLCWPQYVTIYLITLPAFLEVPLTSLAIGEAWEDWTDSDQKIWEEDWRTIFFGSVMRYCSLPMLMLILLLLGIAAHVIGFLYWLHCAMKSWHRLDDHTGFSKKDKESDECARFWFAIYQATDIGNFLLVSKIAGNFVAKHSARKALERTGTGEVFVKIRAIEAQTFKGLDKLDLNARAAKMRATKIDGEIAQENRSHRFMLKCSLGSLVKLWFKISLAQIIFRQRDPRNAGVLLALVQAIVLAFFNTLLGCYQVFPFVQYMAGLQGHALTTFGRCRIVRWTAVLLATFFLIVANIFRLAGLWWCETHVFNLSAYGCLN